MFIKEVEEIYREHRKQLHENPAGLLEIEPEELKEMLTEAFEEGRKYDG